MTEENGISPLIAVDMVSLTMTLLNTLYNNLRARLLTADLIPLLQDDVLCRTNEAVAKCKPSI